MFGLNLVCQTGSCPGSAPPRTSLGSLHLAWPMQCVQHRLQAPTKHAKKVTPCQKCCDVDSTVVCRDRDVQAARYIQTNMVCTANVDARTLHMAQVVANKHPTRPYH